MIETSRLTLRPWKESDWPSVNAILGDADVMQFSDHGVLTEKQQAAWFQAALASGNKLEPPFLLAIERKQNRQIVGYISLVSDLERVQPGDAEIGFRLARNVWGQGCATEAVSALLEMPLSGKRPDRIVAIVDPHNSRSVHVLQKVGMTYCRDIMLEGYDYPDHLYAYDLVR
ncbi:GNAT family N-acetyltransferase [Roseibium sp. MMSF_3544]|uniref:GNAT family N-acetyltransferase n=1 Tax=Roseibium sp. MMSF_3544 TaxID=3046723 RepID=UPI00273E6965|nr:GNAT family N-acetyltransferase [Roseibium sp. MMSF_3544]